MKRISLLAFYYLTVMLSMTVMQFSVFVVMMSLFFELIVIVLMWVVFQSLEEGKLRLGRMDLFISLIPLGLLCFSASWLASNEIGEFVDLPNVHGAEPFIVFWPQLTIAFVLAIIAYAINSFGDYRSEGKFGLDPREFVFLTLLVVLLSYGVFGVLSFATAEFRIAIMITLVVIRLLAEFLLKRYLSKF